MIKDKEKANSRLSTVWDNEGLVVERAHGVMTAEDLKAFCGVPFNVVANQQVHKLVQVTCSSICQFLSSSLIVLTASIFFSGAEESLHLASECLTKEAKVASLMSQMEALEKENSTLKKKPIDSMDKANTLKEKNMTLSDDLGTVHQLTLEKDDQLLAAKDQLKTIAARSIEAFQQTNEYNTVLFSWFFKGFELLRRYLIKHSTRVDLQNLDLKEVDQEIAIDEAAQSTTPEGDAPEKASADDAFTDDTPASDDAAVSD